MLLDFPDGYGLAYTTSAAGSTEPCLEAWDGTPGFLIRSQNVESGRHLTFLVVHDGGNKGWVVEGTEQTRAGTHSLRVGEAQPLREGSMPDIRKWLTPMVNRLGFNEMWVDAHTPAMEPTVQYGRPNAPSTIVAGHIMENVWRPVRTDDADPDVPVPDRVKVSGWYVGLDNVPVGTIYPLDFMPDRGKTYEVGVTIAGPSVLW